MFTAFLIYCCATNTSSHNRTLLSSSFWSQKSGTASQVTSALSFLRSYGNVLVRTVVLSEGSARREEMCSNWFMWLEADVCLSSSLKDAVPPATGFIHREWGEGEGEILPKMRTIVYFYLHHGTRTPLLFHVLFNKWKILGSILSLHGTFYKGGLKNENVNGYREVGLLKS